MYAEWARYLFAYCPFNQCVDPLSPPTIPLHSQSPPCALAENPPAAPCGIQILCSPAPRRVMPLCGPSTSSSSWPPPPVLSPPRPNSGLLAAVGGGPRDVFEVELLECVCGGGSQDIGSRSMVGRQLHRSRIRFLVNFFFVSPVLLFLSREEQLD